MNQTAECQSNECRYVPGYHDTDGSSLQSFLQCSYDDLVKVLGHPQVDALVDDEADYKTSSEWIVFDRMTGSVFTVYDYKATGVYESGLPTVESFRKRASYDWHIGGRTNARAFIFWLKNRIALQCK